VSAPTVPTERLLKLHAQQGQVFESPARFRVVAAGRRWGKTILGVICLLLSAAMAPGRYWYLAPELKQARDIAWKVLVNMVPRSWLRRPPNESRLEIELLNGSVIALHGADHPDSLRGRGIAGIVIDEYADTKENLWDEIILPSLLDTGGWALILGTPKGYDHFYTLYQQGQDPAYPDWASWTFTTADCPLYRDKQDELTGIRRQYEQRGQLRLFLQEYEASFESNAGYILGAMWKPTHTVTETDGHLLRIGCTVGQVIPWHVYDDAQWFPPKEAVIYGSVDYGYGAPWAAYLHAVLPNGHMRTFHEWYQQEVRDVEQAERMRVTIEAFMARGMARPQYIELEPVMFGSRREMGIGKSIAEVYDEGLGQPLHIPLQQGAGGRAARVSRPQRWMAALSVSEHGVPHWSCTTACPHLIRTVPRVPWDEDDPEVEDGDSENHCLVGSTLITTARGEVAIREVVAGDVVLTRRGWRSVRASWKQADAAPVYDVTLSDGRVLTGTSEHPVWVVDRGWVRLNELSEGIMVYDVACLKPRRSSPRRFRSGGVSATTAWSGTSDGADALACIDRSGWTCTAPSRQGTISIIATATPRTIIRIIWNWCRRRVISLCTQFTRASGSAPHAVPTWRLRVASAWGNLRSRIGAYSAAESTWPGLQPILVSTALGPVRGEPPISAHETHDRPSNRGLATSAATSSRRSETEPGSAGSLCVISVRRSGTAAVYDLEVDDAHEFFANGVLVHNSYESIGRFFESRPVGKPLDIGKLALQADLATLDPLSRAEAERIEKRHELKPGRRGVFPAWGKG
jgi:hypothetical protein